MMMKRREFLKILLLSGLFALFTRRADAKEKQTEKPLKVAMFWRQVD
jgi:hypothetical protein